MTGVDLDVAVDVNSVKVGDSVRWMSQFLYAAAVGANVASSSAN